MFSPSVSPAIYIHRTAPRSKSSSRSSTIGYTAADVPSGLSRPIPGNFKKRHEWGKIENHDKYGNHCEEVKSEGNHGAVCT
jgi:hypothetical protein